jgi:hypothetical protein
MKIGHYHILGLVLFSIVCIFIGKILYSISQDGVNAKTPGWTLIHEYSNPSQTGIPENDLLVQIDLMNEAFQKQQDTLCEKIKNPEWKTRCLDTVKEIGAIKEGKIQLCENISATGSRTDCIDAIQSNTAMKEEKVEQCGQLSTSEKRANCEQSIRESIYTKSRIEHPESIIPCQSLSGEVLLNCMNSNLQLQENKIQQQALETQNITLCANIGTTSRKVQCQDRVFYHKALRNTSLNNCRLIQSTYLQDACYR